MERRHDPRPWQTGVLLTLLAWGALGLDFEVDAGRAAATLGAALLTQWACTRLWRLPRFDPRSALLSGLSLSLLLRADAFWPLPLAAMIAVVSKFAIRRDGKHLFNPSCLAIVVLLACSDEVWVSAGQWGTSALFAFAAAGLGTLVVRRAERSDITWAFLGAWTALLAGRALWLGDPLAIPLHALQNGALLVFAFFMISDPRTIPDSRAGRVLFACGVATAAWGLQFVFYQTNSLLWALAGAAPFVPLIDRLLPGGRHAWTDTATTPVGAAPIAVKQIATAGAPA
ncbi:MAG: RnfABCDGE type electron transport complex subunit D [Deltaproteobacteria bacterium]|nr:RnfABCDGE type electron transport complex subunit D [Deltaproteobacteria bacterium]MBW2361340.1 RnfABCDGE type electron transport complex subunit D [Deltaproteobacteria bacterium]